MVFGGTGRPDVTVSLEGTAGIIWNLQILDSTGILRAETTGDETGWAQIDFGGMDADGKPLPDGSYTVLAMAHGKSGIPGSSSITIQKDSRPVNAKVELSAPVLIPGTGERNKVRITPILDVLDSIVQTTIHIVDADGAQIATRSSAGIITFWDWNGQSSEKKSFPDGTYQVALETTYANGTVANAVNELTLDSTYLLDKGPKVEMSLSSKSFIPGNIDGPSSLTIAIQTTEGVVPVQGWKMSITDPQGETFRQFAGNGIPPGEIVWDGKGDNGDIIESGDTYRIILGVSDTQNRETKLSETVTADILVEQLADGKYKIVITSIQFPGYSSDFFKASTDLLEMNMFVLRRLSSILNKFPDYKIRLEGYAVAYSGRTRRLPGRNSSQSFCPCPSNGLLR